LNDVKFDDELSMIVGVNDKENDTESEQKRFYFWKEL
jgi:hypothetical protein